MPEELAVVTGFLILLGVLYLILLYNLGKLPKWTKPILMLFHLPLIAIALLVVGFLFIRDSLAKLTLSHPPRH